MKTLTALLGMLEPTFCIILAVLSYDLQKDARHARQVFWYLFWTVSFIANTYFALTTFEAALWPERNAPSAPTPIDLGIRSV